MIYQNALRQKSCIDLKLFNQHILIFDILISETCCHVSMRVKHQMESPDGKYLVI
jgi:hypothetical protein